MIIISQNISNYDLKIPDESIFRINLAWCNNLKEFESILSQNKEHAMFVDLPVGRIKPPNNKYTLEELVPIINNNKNIKYFAISNVESSKDLELFKKEFPNEVTLVPKIESPNGIKNIEEITEFLNYEKKVVMLDHDDLYSAIVRNNENSDNFEEYIRKLVEFCKTKNISLLRTVGVVFSDDENRITQYVK